MHIAITLTVGENRWDNIFSESIGLDVPGDLETPKDLAVAATQLVIVQPAVTGLMAKAEKALIEESTKTLEDKAESEAVKEANRAKWKAEREKTEADEKQAEAARKVEELEEQVACLKKVAALAEDVPAPEVNDVGTD